MKNYFIYVNEHGKVPFYSRAYEWEYAGERFITHRALFFNGEKWLQSKDSWTVTHADTGFSVVTGITTKRDSEAEAKRRIDSVGDNMQKYIQQAKDKIGE